MDINKNKFQYFAFIIQKSFMNVAEISKKRHCTFNITLSQHSLHSFIHKIFYNHLHNL